MVMFSSLLEHFLDFSFYLFSFILVISVVVFVHEFGHYFIAKLCKVKIESFSIGFGPEIVGCNDKSGTRWKLSWIPFGGYVKMFGDGNVASFPGSDAKELSEDEKKLSFQHKELYKKNLIVLAGPLANILLAIVMFTFLFSLRGQGQMLPIIGEVVQGGAAESAALLPGDVLLSINDCEIHWFNDIKNCLDASEQGELRVRYQRQEIVQSTMLTPQIDSKSPSVKRLGITANGRSELVRLSPPVAFVRSVKETFFVIDYTLHTIVKMITGQQSADSIGGPISIAKYSGESLKGGWAMLMWFIAMISINLGVVNLLPIPLLDGGHLFYYMIEGIFRKRIGGKVQDYATVVGTVILLSLTCFAIFNDVRHILR